MTNQSMCHEYRSPVVKTCTAQQTISSCHEYRVHARPEAAAQVAGACHEYRVSTGTPAPTR